MAVLFTLMVILVPTPAGMSEVMYTLSAVRPGPTYGPKGPVAPPLSEGGYEPQQSEPEMSITMEMSSTDAAAVLVAETCIEVTPMTLANQLEMSAEAST